MGEIHDRRKPHRAAMSATVAAVSATATRTTSSRRGAGAGQDVSRNRDAIGGGEPGQLPLTDADRRSDLFGTESGVVRMLLYIGACGGAVRGRRSRGHVRCQHRDQIQQGALVSWQGPVGSCGPAGDSGECPCVLVVRTAVPEGCDDRPVELRHLRQLDAINLDDELLKAAAEPSGDGWSCQQTRTFPGRSAYVLSAHSNQASPRSVRTQRPPKPPVGNTIAIRRFEPLLPMPPHKAAWWVTGETLRSLLGNPYSGARIGPW